MNRAQFIARLKDCLKSLPADERDNVIRYYEEYFDEAGAEHEKEALAELGSPQKIAMQIKADSAVRNMDKGKNNGLKTFGLVVLAIFAAPIALPLAIGAVALVFGLSVGLIAMVFALCVTALAVFVSGVVALGAGIAGLFYTPATGAFMLGSGLVICSVGVLIIWGAIAICRMCFRGMSRHLNRKTGRQVPGQVNSQPKGKVDINDTKSDESEAAE